LPTKLFSDIIIRSGVERHNEEIRCKSGAAPATVMQTNSESHLKKEGGERMKLSQETYLINET
jgi:hypothetical protein